MLYPLHGGIAQLGERLNGIQKVSGSIPLISTKACQMTGFFLARILCRYAFLLTRKIMISR